MANRFADAVKRIIEPLIPGQQSTTPPEKARIPGDRSIGYMVNGTVQNVSGVAGVDMAPTTTEATIQSASDAAANAVGDFAVSQFSGLDSAAGAVDAAAQLAAASAGILPDGTYSSVDNGIQSYIDLDKGSRLLMLTGLKDPATGALFSVRTDGFYPPPTGWDGSDTPPTGTGWDQDYYWSATNFAGTSYGSTVYEAGANQMNATLGYVTGLGPVTHVAYSTTTYDGTGSSADYTIIYTAGATEIPNNIGCTRLDCISEGNPSAYCTLTEPSTSFVPWPSDTVSVLSLIGGQFVRSIRDTQTSVNYVVPRSTLSAQTVTGSTPVELTVLRNGGFAYYQTAAGVATGVVQLYNQNQRFAGYTDAAGLARLLP